MHPQLPEKSIHQIPFSIFRGWGGGQYSRRNKLAAGKGMPFSFIHKVFIIELKTNDLIRIQLTDKQNWSYITASRFVWLHIFTYFNMHYSSVLVKKH